MVFPRWTNKVPFWLLVTLTLLVCAIVFIFWYWASPKHLEVGYQPRQPIDYSHKLHAGQLGIDCRYCHHLVDKSKFAGVPATETCLNCHTQIKKDSPEIVKLREFHAAGKPVPWVRVHKLPDYVYFDHSAHVNKGVSCISCHGRVDQMDVVRQTEPMSMAWCMDCHEAPAANIRDKSLVTKLAWTPEGDALESGRKFMDMYHVKPRTDCTTCHR